MAYTNVRQCLCSERLIGHWGFLDNHECASIYCHREFCFRIVTHAVMHACARHTRSIDGCRHNHAYQVAAPMRLLSRYIPSLYIDPYVSLFMSNACWWWELVKCVGYWSRDNRLMKTNHGAYALKQSICSKVAGGGPELYIRDLKAMGLGAY